jgi:hypothetical protein
MLFAKNELHDEISHRNISAMAVASARAIVQSHPGHPVTPSEVLEASDASCRGAISSFTASIRWQRFMDEERLYRDTVSAEEVRERFALEQFMREYTTAVNDFVRCALQRGESSGVAIAACTAVLKIIVKQEMLSS